MTLGVWHEVTIGVWHGYCRRTGVEQSSARTLVGADGCRELDAVAAVDVLLARVIHPCHAELDHALRLHQTRLNRPHSFKTGKRVERMDSPNSVHV